MTDETNPRENRSRGTAVVVVGIALMVLYPLSIGPVEWMDRQGYLGPHDGPLVQTLQVLYFPIIYLYLNVDSARDLIDWYFELWRL